uniref:Uncharacterized protein n=1 Tax=Rhizophora mucronata TaxID=61149 RepID=A0A2P2N912_RHIMU
MYPNDFHWFITYLFFIFLGTTEL